MSVFKYADSIRDELKECLIPFQKAIHPLLKIQEDLKSIKDKNIDDWNALKARLKKLEAMIEENEEEIAFLTERQEKLKMKEIFYSKVIEEESIRGY